VRTERLLLRGWRPDDLPRYAALNADPEVIEFLPGPLTYEQSAAHVDRIRVHFAEHGFGLWAVDVLEPPAGGAGGFVGFVGLSVPGFTAPFTPCVEVGWRLARAAWGHGYASEGARAALAFGVGPAGLDEIVSFTAVSNFRSQAVMARIGMVRDPAADFDHPSLPAHHPLRPHVLYRYPRPS
jgi:ribosomal-protein-alanine N-acetyltransferase